MNHIVCIELIGNPGIKNSHAYMYGNMLMWRPDFCFMHAACCQMLSCIAACMLHLIALLRRDNHAGVKYVEASLPESTGLASLLDQQALVQFLADKLPEAEAAAARMLALAERLFADEEAAVAMCSLRLGTALAGAHTCLSISSRKTQLLQGKC